MVSGHDGELFDLPKLTFSKLNWTARALRLSKLNGTPLWIAVLVQDPRTTNSTVISHAPAAPGPVPHQHPFPEKASFFAALDLRGVSSVFQAIRKANHPFAFTGEERKYV